MIALSGKVARLRSVAVLALALGAVTLAPGCKKKEKAESDEAKTEKKEGAEGEEKAREWKEGPCGEYDKAICEKAGLQTPSCQMTKSFTENVSDKACKALHAEIAETFKKFEAAKLKCDELSKKICDHLGAETKTCKETSEQIKGMPPEQCKGALEHIDDVLKDLERREAANKPLSEEVQKELTADGAPSFGSADAKVTIVEFSDFQCPYCTRAADATHAIKEKYGDKVRFVFRQFPLSFHQNAHLAAQASLAANAQGKFWELHDLMFKNQKELARENLDAYAKEIGLDMAKFKSALDEGTFKDAVDADMALGGKVSVSGTPSMFINGKRAANATAAEPLFAEIDAALAAK